MVDWRAKVCMYTLTQSAADGASSLCRLLASGSVCLSHLGRAMTQRIAQRLDHAAGVGCGVLSRSSVDDSWRLLASLVPRKDIWAQHWRLCACTTVLFIKTTDYRIARAHRCIRCRPGPFYLVRYGRQCA